MWLVSRFDRTQMCQQDCGTKNNTVMDELSDKESFVADSVDDSEEKFAEGAEEEEGEEEEDANENSDADVRERCQACLKESFAFVVFQTW
jgi:hypothetical protein